MYGRQKIKQEKSDNNTNLGSNDMKLELNWFLLAFIPSSWFPKKKKK